MLWRTALCCLAVIALALPAFADDRPTPEAAKARAVAEIAVAKATQSVKAASACPCSPECDCPVCDCGTEATLAKAHATALVIEAKHRARQTAEPPLLVPSPPVVRPPASPGNSVRVPEPLPQPTCRLVWDARSRTWVQVCPNR